VDAGDSPAVGVPAPSCARTHRGRGPAVGRLLSPGKLSEVSDYGA
jgi:hypothetical protein